MQYRTSSGIYFLVHTRRVQPRRCFAERDGRIFGEGYAAIEKLLDYIYFERDIRFEVRCGKEEFEYTKIPSLLRQHWSK